MTDDLLKRLRDRDAYAKSNGWDNVVFGQAADRIEQLENKLQLAIEMRLTQKLYFKERTPDLLINSKMCEAAFDRVMVEKKDD